MQIRLSLLARRGAGRDCDVLVTAPAGTQLSAVAAGLKQAARAGETTSSWWVDGTRLDPHRAVLGEPPLVDGAVLALGGPAGPGGEPDPTAPQLQVVSGPDAGGVHVLHGGEVRIGRSAEADVTLDDPDVSRAHCAVVLGPGGRVEVADLGSTNGTSIEGRPVGRTPQPLPRGALLRVGESVLRVVAGGTQPPVATVPDGEGHVRVRAGADEGARAVAGEWRETEGSPEAGERPEAGAPRTRTPEVPRPAGGPRTASPHGADATHAAQGLRGLHEARDSLDARDGRDAQDAGEARPHPFDGAPERDAPAPQDPGETRTARRKGGLGRWGRRRGPRTDEAAATAAGQATTAGPAAPEAPLPPAPVPLPARSPDAWPDPALLLLTALGPGPRLWERGPGHPEALACRVGTSEHPRPEGGALPVPLTVSLAESGSLGLAGPRERLSGLARAVLAQYAALHSPDTLEIVLVSTDRHQPLAERVARWGWLGWLPHVRPTRGQECRALLAYDNEQAAARFAEVRGRTTGQYEGLRTLVVLDGDPGTPALREAAAWCASAEGRAAGVHLVCLAETAAASPASPVAETFEAACAQVAAFRDCGAVALLSGDVATAVHVLRAAHGRLAGHGTTGTVDAVSAAWAERFARALAPLRTDAAQGAPRTAATASPLPQAVRLLDELGLARATPASLLARWASAAEEAREGRVLGVLGAGPEGPAHVDLGGAQGPHLIIEGPAGSGRTELLRALAASLAAGERPDRLGLVLVDGAGAQPEGAGLGVCAELPHVTTVLRAQDPVRMREFAQALAGELKRRARLLDGGGTASGEPLVPAQGGVGDTPSGRVRARGAAGQGPGAGTGSGTGPGSGPASGPAGGDGPAGGLGGTGAGPGGPRAAAVSVAARTSRVREQEARARVMFDQEQPPSGPAYERERSRYGQERAAHGPYGRPRVPYDQEADQRPAPHPADATAANSADHPGNSVPPQSRGAESGDIEAPPSRTLRLRPRTSSGARNPLPRLVVLVDDVDALLDPPLGATGRPAAGSVVRALEAVVRDGARLGVHLIAAGARTEKAAASYVARAAGVRVVLDAPSPAPEDPAPGRGRLLTQDGAALPFQAGRVTGRIPRTATLRPTVTALEWPKMGDAPERARPVRELGNGPTDLALLASALDRAARAAEAKPQEPLL
ncbi:MULTISPECIES: FHA domain-containing protein [unclassified Streptomyces]|uniref:FHA domain-containing protein n=1 Tax=unclassified Streptomyces TaxID=2593676 RepID=UPI001011F646|nr:FHA domain-containing protein [Streptomyces sp. GZWMJZ-114]